MPIGSDQVGLDAIIIGILAVLARAPGVGGAEQRGGGLRFAGAAGQRRDAGIEGAQKGFQGFGRVALLIDGTNNTLRRSRVRPQDH